MNNLQIELGNLRLENYNLKYQLTILLNEKRERLNNDEEKINYEQTILELKTKINELTTKCDDLVFQNEVLNEEIEYQKSKFHTQQIGPERIQFYQQQAQNKKNTKDQSQLSYSELSQQIFDQSQRIIKLELEKQDLTAKLKKYEKFANNDNESNNSTFQNEEQIKKLQKQLESKEKENQKQAQQIKELQKQLLSHSKIEYPQPPLLDKLDFGAQSLYQDYDVHHSQFSKILSQQ